MRFLDLFAGAGGLSEGFIQAGYIPVAHVEQDKAACNTLRTRAVYHKLKKSDRLEVYEDYLYGRISRQDLYLHEPDEINNIICEMINGDSISHIFNTIDQLLDNQRLDLIIGGPPCQAYSIVGRSRTKNKMIGDERNYLFHYYGEFLKRYKPQYFVFENVLGLLSARDENGFNYLESMINLFYMIGYETELMTLSAERYGVLQKRKRVILVGRKGKRTGFYPTPVVWQPEVSVNDALFDLPALRAGEGVIGPCKATIYDGNWQIKAGIRNESLPITWHQARPATNHDLEIYRIVVEHWNNYKTRLNYNELPERLKSHRHRESFTDRFKVVASDLPYSHTVVAHIAKDGHYYIHPDLTQNRSITPREAARLQSFPDDYYFESSGVVPRRTPVYRQIGNAVPVLLARRIAEKLKEVWF